MSDFKEINCGVPQGSILGPILFLCYVSDMAISLGCHLSLYADSCSFWEDCVRIGCIFVQPIGEE